MSQIVVHFTEKPTQEQRERALGADGARLLRPLLGGWYDYLPLNGTIAAVRRKGALAETEALQFGLKVSVEIPRDLPTWIAENGYLPNHLRETESNFCVTALATPDGLREASDPTDPVSYPFHFVARDRDDVVFGRGSCSSAGTSAALAAFVRSGATHLDLYRRNADGSRGTKIDTLRG